MTVPRAVLHNVQLQSQPIRLSRPTFSTEASSKLAPTEELSGHQKLGKEHSRQPASMPVHPTGHQALEMAKQQGQRIGYEAGYKDGLAQARRDAQEQVEKLAQELARKHVNEAHSWAEQQAQKQIQQLKSQLQQQYDRITYLSQELPAQLVQYLQDVEDDMLALVYEVVCRILGDEAASLPGLRAQLQLSLKAWNGRTMLSVHVHPDDLELLQGDVSSQKLLRSAGFSTDKSSLRWVSDPKINLGGCLLRSSEGELDARLEVQLQTLQTVLLKTRAARKTLPAPAAPENTP